MQLYPVPLSARPTLRIVFWVTFTCWILPELVAWKVRRSAQSASSVDKGSLNLISILWSIGIGMAFLLSELVPSAAIEWNRTSVFVAGIALMLVGTAFRWYSAGVLGKHFTFDVAIHDDHALVEAGPYRYIRHPSYSGALLSLLGFGMTLGNWAAFAVSLSCLAGAYGYRIPIEEAALTSAFGESYRQYVRKTWRLVPFLF